MPRPRVQFTIGRLMIVVAASAMVLAPFAWLPRDSRAMFLIDSLIVCALFLIVASPFLLDRLDGHPGPRPRRPTAIPRRPPSRPGR